MKTLKELNEKAWYRFSKIIYIVLFSLAYLFLVMSGLSEIGRDYHPPFYPDTLIVALNDPNFYKVSDYDKKVALSFMDNSFHTYDDNTTQFIEKIKRIDIKTKEIKDTKLIPISLDDVLLAESGTNESLDSIMAAIKRDKAEEVVWIGSGRGFVAVPRKNPIPQEGAREKYIYESYYTWNIEKSIKFFVIVTLCYSLLMAIIRSAFYYVAIGKLFPKE